MNMIKSIIKGIYKKYRDYKVVKKLQILDSFSLFHGNGEWICHIEGLKFVINSKQELHILEEVFIEGIYNIEINQPFIFIDIGMNVGITSLFFAKKDICKKIIAFEPFEPTLFFAKNNFAKNNISQKIEVHETGLGYPSRTIKVNYSESYKGSVGINGSSYIKTESKDIREEQLKITDVFEALKDIIDEKIILKIDCEGAEYEILERLNDTGLLRRYSIIMIEWHINGPNILKKILINNGFEVFSLGDYNSIVGMLYAFRT